MKIAYVIGGGVMAFGALFVGVGVLVVQQDTRAIAHSQRAEGVVIDRPWDVDKKGDGGYRATVRFATADGREVTVRSRAKAIRPLFDLGEKVTVIYDPALPDRAILDTFGERYMGSLIFAVLGGGAMLIGFGIVATQARTALKARRLKATGERLQGRVVGFGRDTRTVVNGEPAWTVIAEWRDPATGEPRRGESRSILSEPEAREGEAVEVYVDRRDPTSFFVDAR